MRILFITSSPSFYKDNLFLGMSEKCYLSVIYTNNERIKRNADFYSTNFTQFQFFSKNEFFSNFKKIINTNDFDRIILSGWDDIYYWVARLFLPKMKLRVIIESSIFEYKSNFILNLLKRFFLRGIDCAIVSGSPQHELINMLGFRGKVLKSSGVGILDFNYQRPSAQLKVIINKFLFIGRISKIKGIDLLINFFRNNPDLFLYLVGEFEDEEYRGEIDKLPNIIYKGYKRREELLSVFEESDVLILPSFIEPWGLVVEEAIFHGLPTLVSNRVGCSKDLIESFELGKVFDPYNYINFSMAITEITNINNYNRYRENIFNFNFKDKEINYVNSFLT